MTRPLAPCGTDAAYQRHYRRGEPIDDACREAHNAKNGPLRRAARASEGTPCTSCPGMRKPYTGLPSKDWCQNCYDRWKRAGRPADGPPPPPANPSEPGAEANRRKSAERRQEYYDLRDLMGFTPEQAASDIDISPRTARKWDKRREAVSA